MKAADLVQVKKLLAERADIEKLLASGNEAGVYLVGNGQSLGESVCVELQQIRHVLEHVLVKNTYELKMLGVEI